LLSAPEFEAIFEAAPDGILVVDADGAIKAANPKIEQIFGWSPEELSGSPIEVLIPEAVRKSHERHRESFVGSPRDRPMGVGLDLRGLRKDGTDFPVEVSLSPWLRSQDDLLVICTVRDVSGYRRLQNFSEGALRASEEERQRIARELHDDTAQRLATLILRVRMLAQESNDYRRAKLFDEVRSEIVEAADAVKRLSRGLRPPEIEELGLRLALRAHIRTLRETGVFRVSAELGLVDPFLDVTAKLALYRIVQEALSNARRHSGAESARVRLLLEDDAVVAEIIDRGSGFPIPSAINGEEGLGLIGMQERATMIGGRITIDSLPEEGTRVRVVVPVRTSKG